MNEPKIIEGGIAVDDRGVLNFVNTFDFSGVKRFYQVENFSRDVIRAWHGHLKEGKYVYVAKGSAIVAAVLLDDKVNPSKVNPIKRFVLSAKSPKIVYFPPGYANGFKPLEDGTILQYFSTSTLEESKGDDYRFPADYWGAAVWATENR